MTKEKAQKRVIRERMTKTGERYTTARLYALELHHAQDALPAAEAPVGDVAEISDLAAAEPAILPPRVAEPGASDAAVQRATGKTWDEWLTLLDAWGGTGRTHPEIARHVQETSGISGWWAQSVTVGYERARGMRAMHERPDGFSVNASKTIAVPRERLYAAIADADERERWLDDVLLRWRSGQPDKSARFDVLSGETRLNVTVISRGPEKSTIQLQQERLASADEVERWRIVWRAQLARLASYLAAQAGAQ